jgi:hypothetical protein
MTDLTYKQDKEKRFEQLKDTHRNWIEGYKELSDYIDQTRGIFDGDRSKIGKRINHKKLLDSHGTYAKRITASGLQSGLTDQTRPWFKLELDKIVIDSTQGVREWLDEVNRRMIDVFNSSNLYKVFQNCYDELVQFGTGCFIVLEDDEDIVRAKSFTVGEYYLGVNHKGRVNTFAREFELSVGQMVNEFGLEACSGRVKALYEDNQLEQMIKIRHMIEPNRFYGAKSDETDMPYSSCYWELGNNDVLFLRQGGFRIFPVIAPRWDTMTTEVAYGYGPGWHALGDIKELQIVHRDYLITQEKIYNPPTIQDASVDGHTNLLPGGVTKSSMTVPNTGVRAAYQINPSMDWFKVSIDMLHEKINRAMFADIFLMISSMDRTNITAFEVAKRENEKMMMLGPVLHNLTEEMLDKVIDLVFDIMNERGLIPPPPQEVQGMELKVRYVSILAQAQKMVGIEQIRSTIAFAGEAAQIWPNVKDNINIDEALREVNSMSGAPASIILDPTIVEANREAALQQQNQMIALEASEKASKMANQLSRSKVGEGSMLDVIGQAAQQQTGR